MADLINRVALFADIDEAVVYSGRICTNAEMRGANKIVDRIKAAKAVDAVEVKVLRRQLLKAGTLMYGGDEGFEKRIGGYNPSSFVAGFNYALELMNAWSKSLEAERRTDETDRC